MSPPSPNVDTVGEPGHKDLKPAVLQTEDREGPILRSAEDDLSVWQGVRRFKRAGCIAMLAAFSAAPTTDMRHRFSTSRAVPF